MYLMDDYNLVVDSYVMTEIKNLRCFFFKKKIKKIY